MKAHQRAGLIGFLCGLGLIIITTIERFIKGETTGQIWLIVTLVLVGGILFMIGE